jgi:hypothetical protein
MAEPFYLRYDASAFPEAVGWDRLLNDPEQALDRSLADGNLALDTRGSLLISDLYSVSDSSIAPGSGETLDLRWRVQTLYSSDSYGSSEVAVTILNPARAYVSLRIGPDFVAEDRFRFGYQDLIAPISIDAPHSYHVQTADFATYSLFVDGALAFEGDFHWQAIPTGPSIYFGDTLIGGTVSVASWDFLEVSVSPEPRSLLMLFLPLALARFMRHTVSGVGAPR